MSKRIIFLKLVLFIGFILGEDCSGRGTTNASCKQDSDCNTNKCRGGKCEQGQRGDYCVEDADCAPNVGCFNPEPGPDYCGGSSRSLTSKQLKKHSK